MPQEPGPVAESPPAPPRFALRWWIGAAVVAVLLYAAFAFVGDIQAVAGELRHVRGVTALAALAAVTLGYMVRALRWHYFVAPWSPRPEVVGSSLAFVAGFAMGITPGKVGELVKIYYQWDRDGTPVSASLGATFAERGLDVLTLLILMAIGIAVAPAGSVWGLLLLFILAIAGLVAVRNLGLVRALLRGLGRIKMLARAMAHIEQGHAALHKSLSGPRLVLGLTIGVAAWALEPLAMRLLARDLGLDIPYATAAFVFAAVSLFGVLTLVPGGLGTFEGGSIFLLTSIAGATISQAAALTLLIRIATLWYGVVLGALAIGVLRILRAQRTRTAAEDTRHTDSDDVS